MHRIALFLSLVCLVAVGCADEKGPVIVGEATQAVQSVCTKSLSDPAARWPWEATYPLGAQHVFCQHVVGETSSSTWPAGAGACTPDATGNQIPGLGQADVWVRNATSPGTSYWCTRVTIAIGQPFHLVYEQTLEFGWLTLLNGNIGDPYRRWIQGVTVGPGVKMVTGSIQSWGGNAPTSCPMPPDTSCYSLARTAAQSAQWIQVDSTQYSETIDLRRVP